MRRVKRCVITACVAVLVIGMTTCVQATAIDIINPGFDADTVPAEGYVIGAPTGWSAIGGLAGYQLGNAGLPALSSPNWAFISNGDNPNGGIYQMLQVGGTALHANAGDQITIGVAQGRRSDIYVGVEQDFSIQIYRDAVGGGGTQAYDSGNLGSGTLGEWVSRSVTYTATTADVGHDLYVLLWSNTNNQVQLDNVSGTYSPVPEPGTIGLLCTGLIGLLAYAWRKRR